MKPDILDSSMQIQPLTNYQQKQNTLLSLPVYVCCCELWMLFAEIGFFFIMGIFMHGIIWSAPALKQMEDKIIMFVWNSRIWILFTLYYSSVLRSMFKWWLVLISKICLSVLKDMLDKQNSFEKFFQKQEHI